MTKDRIPSLSTHHRKEIAGAAALLYETADHLISITRAAGPDLINARWLIKQAHIKVYELTQRFEIDV